MKQFRSILPGNLQAIRVSRQASAFAVFSLTLINLFPIGMFPVGIPLEKTWADQFQVSLKSGSVLTIETDDQSIQWTDVLADGRMQKRPIQFSEIDRLVLSESPASQQVAQIRNYLSMLASPNYLDRELAEDQLSNPAIGARFLTLIRTELEHPKLEVRYRVGRIVARLDDAEVDTLTEFDSVLLENGQSFEGDAGDFRLDFVYRGQPLSLTRAGIRLIARPTPSTTIGNAKHATVDVQAFQDFQGQFYQPGQTTIDFDTAPGGSELRRNADVSEVFIPYGVILGTEKSGFVGISGYGFNNQPMADGNSVCVFETVGSYSKRFKGVMEIRFCMPNQRSVVAGVTEIGMFIARVDARRDFIVEGYNANGQILACVEASGAGCVFAGIKSTEPITFVRILSNPYLYRVSRKVDEDFAIDHLCFSAPVPVIGSPEAEVSVVRLRNGDLLKGQSFQPANDQVSLEAESIDQKITIPIADVQSIRFDTQPIQLGAGQRPWLAMLADRSVLRVDPGKQIVSQMFEDLTFDPDQVTALWLASNKVRFPLQGDFDRGQRVMVFPTCRIAAKDLEFTQRGYGWKQSEKLEQKLEPQNKDQQDDEEEEDPTPDISEVDYAETSPENIPTIWTRRPPGQSSGTGMLRLIDGQQLVLEGSVGFRITDINENAVSVAIGAQKKVIPISQILSIDFPSRQ